MLMGILNMTPDSFSDGGKFNINSKAFKRISEMTNSGANIIDIGGESTRPGSKIIHPKIEWKRVDKVIKKFKKNFPKTLLSVDTRKSSVMEKAIKSKVDIINDVSCFKFDKKSFKTISNKNLYKIVHHMKGTPQTMQIKPKYNHVLLDIYDFFEREIKKLKGDKYQKKIILDPGIGFGKNTEHNLDILKNLDVFANLGYYTLLGTSRKKIFSEVSSNNNPEDRVAGTCATSALGVISNINIFRVHDVWQNKQAIDIAFAIKNS